MLKKSVLCVVTVAAVALSVAAAEVRRVKLPPRNARGLTGQVQLAPFDSAAWIWRADEPLPQGGEFVRFRKAFSADGATPLRFHVSADERYVLQLDGKTVARGPDRGDPKLWFASTYETLPEKGEHLVEAICWRMPSDLSPNAQLTWRGGFLFKAEGVYDAQLTTGRAKWTAAKLGGTRMTSCKYPAGCVGAQTEITGTGIEDERPADAAYGPVHVVRGPLPAPDQKGSTFCDGWLLYPTELPEQMAREVKNPGAFKAADDQTFATNGVWSKAARAWCSNGWYRASAATSPYVAQANALLNEGRALTIPANAKVRLLWNLGDYYCCYNEMTVSGGKGAKIGWGWAESLYTGDAFDWHTVVVGKERKGMTSRLKWEDKYFYGNEDVFRPDGRAHARFTMPWWHCGFWCQIEVETAAEPLVIENVKLVETRYPMEPQAYFECDDASIAGVRRLCLRGLRECMHEMHFDCPYYEQQMYPGDTRIQMLTAAAMNADDSLTRQAFRLLEISQKENGMVSMNYPTTWRQISATFSLIWTYMLGDYAMWHDDVAWVRARMPAVRKWLEGLEAHAGPDGLGSELPGWSFVDWVPGWNDFRGVPPGARFGEDGSSVVNLEYLYALRSAVKVETLLGEAEFAARWNRKAEELAKAIERKYWCETRGLVADNGAQTAFSEHAQCLALLADALPEAKAARAFKGLLEAPDLERCTVSFSHYLFDALISRGRADLVLKRLDLWRDMVRQDLRCPLEGPGDSRSDCHGWGAHPIYHFQTGLAGVKPASPGFRTVRVAPQPGGLRWIKAGTPSPKGLVEEDLRFDGDRVSGTVTLPAGLTGTFVWRGVSSSLVSGVNRIDRW